MLKERAGRVNAISTRKDLRIFQKRTWKRYQPKCRMRWINLELDEIVHIKE
jgi:hypothetical protein